MSEQPRSSEGVAIGSRIRQAREARDLRQVHLAQDIGVSKQAVSQYERGVFAPKPDVMLRISKRLHVALDWLNSGSGPLPDFNTPRKRRGRWGRTDPMLFESPSADSPPVQGMIPEMMSGIGGDGPYLPHETVAQWWRIPPSVIERFVSPPYSMSTPEMSKRLRVFRVHCDNMEPTIPCGSYIIVDTKQTTPCDFGIYTIDYGISAALKRIHIEFDTGVWANVLRLSNDADDDSTVFPVKAVRIIGRCITQMCWADTRPLDASADALAKLPKLRGRDHGRKEE